MRRMLRPVAITISLLVLIGCLLPDCLADSGQSWQQIGIPGEIRQIVDVPGTEGQLYLVSSTGVWKTNDGGATWEATISGQGVAAVAMLTEQPQISFAQPLLKDSQLRGEVLSLGADPLDPNALLVGTAKGGIYSVDIETRCVTYIGGSLPSLVDVLGVTRVLTGPESWLVASTTGGLFTSPDGGASWLITGPGAIMEGRATCVAIDDQNPSVLLVGTAENGLVLSDFAPRGPNPRTWAIVMVVAGLLGLVIIVIILTLRPANRWTIRDSQANLRLDQWEAWNDQIERELQTNLIVTSEMIETVPEQIRTLAMRRYVDTHRHQDLILSQEPLAIEPSRRIELDILANNWHSLIESLPSQDSALSNASRIVDQLCQVLGFTQVNRQVYRSVVGVMVDAPTVRLSLPRQFPIMVILNTEPSLADVRDMRDMARMLGATSFFALTIVPNLAQRTPQAQKALMDLVRADGDDFELMDYQDIVQIYLAADPARELARLILSQIDINLVSPYVMWGPVPENMFFGRHYELNAIMQALPDKSFCLVGGRKIGKTSVLAQIGQLVDATPGLFALRIDCQHVGDQHAFFEALAMVSGTSITEEMPDALRRVLVRLVHKHRGDHLVLILDEVGRLLTYDAGQGMRLFRTFSSLAQEGLVTFVFCGERLLNHAVHDPTFPLFNGCNAVQLGYLREQDVKSIVVEPMRNLGLMIDNSQALVRQVATLSACHPNVVQYICQQLILRACGRDNRAVRLSDIDAIRDSQPFREFLFEIIWGDATTLEKLITVVMADCPRFGRDQVALALQQLGCSVTGDLLDKSLYELCLLDILAMDHDQFNFQAESLAALLIEPDLQRMFTDSLVSSLRQEFPAVATQN